MDNNLSLYQDNGDSSMADTLGRFKKPNILRNNPLSELYSMVTKMNRQVVVRSICLRARDKSVLGNLVSRSFNIENRVERKVKGHRFLRLTSENDKKNRNSIVEYSDDEIDEEGQPFMGRDKTRK